MKKENKILNVPNMLSLLRCLLVPFFVVAFLLLKEMPIAGRVVPAAIFAVTAFTDMLDGKIARKYGLVTNFGKFIDPLADKFMVFAALLSLCVVYGEIAHFFIYVSILIFFRELGVTSLRLVVSGQSGIVVAASFLGKMKTVSQIFGILLIILEPLLIPSLVADGIYLISYIASAVMVVTTLWSGFDYLRAYWPVVKNNA